MIPDFNKSGWLPEGIHKADWTELYKRFGWNERRKHMMNGLLKALEELKSAGCSKVWVNGSFVSAKDYPNDYDACWDVEGVDLGRLDPVIQMLRGKAEQRSRYFGELFPVSSQEDQMIRFFQTDKNTGIKKGMIRLELRGF
jgi:hypothetical protein